MTTTIHPDHHIAAVRAAHAAELAEAVKWLLDDAFIDGTGALVVRGDGEELREDLAADHLEPDAFRRQLIALVDRLPLTGAYHRVEKRRLDHSLLNDLALHRLVKRENDPRVQLVEQLAAKEPEDGYTPGALQQALGAADLDQWDRDDLELFLMVILGLAPERQLDAIAARAKAELDKLAEFDRGVEQATAGREAAF
jgi:autotransporter translocation and assembly factor TamB